MSLLANNWLCTLCRQRDFICCEKDSFSSKLTTAWKKENTALSQFVGVLTNKRTGKMIPIMNSYFDLGEKI